MKIFGKVAAIALVTVFCLPFALTNSVSANPMQDDGIQEPGKGGSQDDNGITPWAPGKPCPNQGIDPQNAQIVAGPSICDAKIKIEVKGFALTLEANCPSFVELIPPYHNIKFNAGTRLYNAQKVFHQRTTYKCSLGWFWNTCTMDQAWHDTANFKWVYQVTTCPTIIQ